MTATSKNLIEKFELILNTLNHILIGFIAIYMTWYGFSNNLTGPPLHAWLCTLAYHFLMAEAILCFYPANVLTTPYSTLTKRYIHLVLQIIGAGLGLGGAIYIIVKMGGFDLKYTHQIFGLTTSILLILNLFFGISAFFSIRLRHIMSPITLKTIHMFFGLSGYVISMVTFHYGVINLKGSVDVTFVTMLVSFSIITIFLTLIGALKSLYRNVTGMCIGN